MNLMKKRTSMPVVTGCHHMTWRELAEADDLASSITVDAMLGFSTHKMTEMKSRITDRIKTKFRETITSFQKHRCYETAYDQLTADPNIVKRSWKLDSRFKEHVFRYLLLFDDRSGVEIRPCLRYASENHIGAAIFASKDWPKGSRITTLVGCIAELNLSDEIAFLKHRKNDFSVMYSSRKNCSQLWLGPAAYVNHDCQPNCEFTINCDGDAQMSLEAKTDIAKGDEIFIYYGKHFFDVNNSACECFTCELLGRGYFTKFVKEQQQHPEITSTHPSSSPLRCLTNQVDPVCHTIGRSNPMHCPQNVTLLKTCKKETAEEIRKKDDDCYALPVGLANLASTLTNANSLHGFFPKGSSAGLACRALPNAYSLRHTGTRLNRVKARIRAATEAAMNASQPASVEVASDIPARTARRASSTQLTKPSFAMKRSSCPQITQPLPSDDPVHATRRTMLLRSAHTAKSNLLAESTSSVCLNRIGASCRRSRSKPSGETAALKPQPSSTEPGEFGPSTAPVHGGSPPPPQLDRASSMDSVSMPSQLSTAANTPDLQSTYYHGLHDTLYNLSMPTLRMGSQYDRLANSGCHSQNSSGDTSSTSPARTIEPILDRLLNETRVLESSFSNYSSTPVKKSAKRLTNYDARLIAEANRLPPVPSRRPRRQSPQFVEEYVGTTNVSGDRCLARQRTTRLSRSADATDSKHANSSRNRRDDIRSNKCNSTELKDNFSAYSAPPSKRVRRQQKADSADMSDTTKPVLSAPGDLSPHPSVSQTSSVLEMVPDSTSDVASEPPHIYPILTCEFDEELLPNPGEDEDHRYFAADFDQSCSTTPLRTDPMDDSDISVDQTGTDNTCSFSSFATEPLEYIYTDHDYTRHYVAGTKTADRCVHSLSQSTPNFSTRFSKNCPNQFLAPTSTPPPPILHPVTPPGLERMDPAVSSSPLHGSQWPCERRLYTPSTPQSCPPRPPSFWSSASTSEVLVKSSARHLMPLEQRLTVTLRRVGPQSYQISHPEEAYLSQ